MTNGVDEQIWTTAFLVDADGIPFGLGGSACPESCKRKLQSVETHQGGDVPDLAGYTIDSIRLVVRDSSWRIERPVPPSFCPSGCAGYVLRHSFELVWEIYGHPETADRPDPPQDRPAKRRHKPWDQSRRWGAPRYESHFGYQPPSALRQAMRRSYGLDVWEATGGFGIF